MPNHNINLEAMEISFPCASPAPFPRMTPDGVPYLETLQITPEAVDLSRLNGGASILKNHDPEKILGTCLKAWIENDQLWVRAKFRQNDPDSVAAFRDIADGTLRNVSVGYEQQQVDFSRKKSDTLPITGEVVRWLPLEVSVEVGIPADPTVGFYRSYNIKGAIPAMTEEEKKELQPIGDPENEDQQEKPAEEKPAEPAEKAAEEETPSTPSTPSDPSEEEKPAEEEKPSNPSTPSTPSTSADETAIRSIAAAYGAAEAFIARALAQKMTPAAFAEKCRKADQKIFKKGAYMPKITTRETSPFNFGNALRAAVSGDFRSAEHELGISDHLFRSFGHEAQSPHSFMMPLTRDFTGETAPAMIGTELRDDLFVDYIGNRLGVKGFESITGLKQNITIPVQTTTSTPKGKKLNQAAEASTINVVPKTLSPKRITTYIDIGKDLILQGVPSAEAKVINDLTKSLACATDIALFRGYEIDSDTKIKGVLETDGLNTVTIADMSKATWADMVKFAAHVEGKDYSGSAPAWVGSASDKGNFKCISKDAGSGRFILEDNQIDGYAYNVDGNAAAGELVFGYWNALTLAQWAGLEILIDPYTLGTKGMLRIVGSIYVDACVTAPSLFVKRVAG